MSAKFLSALVLDDVEYVGNTKTTERGGESVVYKLKQFYAF
jgi:hypothetical protein